MIFSLVLIVLIALLGCGDDGNILITEPEPINAAPRVSLDDIGALALPLDISTLNSE